MRRFAVQVSEVATAATRHQDLLADLVRTLQNDDAAITLPRRDGAHKAGRATAKNNDVEIAHRSNIPITRRANSLLMSVSRISPFRPELTYGTVFRPAFR